MAFGWWSCPRRLRVPSRLSANVALLWLVVIHVSHAALTTRHQEIHKKMSVDDLRRTFQVEHHSQVPEYEIIHLSKRSVSASSSTTTPSPPTNSTTTNLRLKAFGRRLTLRLERADSLLGPSGRVPMWEATPNTLHPHKVSYTQLDDKGDSDLGELYQDESQLAALLLHKSDEGKTLVEGTIGHDLVVKPVPASVRQHLEEHGPHDDDEAFLDEDEDEDLLAEDEEVDDDEELQHEPLDHPHIVFRRATNYEPSESSDFAFMEPDALIKTMKRKRRQISKREAPYAIYPEILVIVDFDGYRLHNGDNVQIKRYFISFWNGVDLRYKTLKGPKIRISIAGIIISRGRDATPYLERNRVGRDAIDSAAALTDMGKYLFRERRLPVYDIAVAVTKLDMCRRQFPTDKCNRGTAGFAYVGGACVVNKRLEKVNSVAIIEDTGGFSGIIVGAHEVGHLLGAVHDGSPPPSYLGGPGAEKCRWEDGFIMSDLRHTEKGFRWSACSVSSFHHFLNGDTATCLFNSPHEDESLPRVLPGKMLSLDAQCRKDRGTAACFKDERVCSQLFCFDSGSGYCIAYRPAAEGSPCGDGQYCLSGRCVAEHENIIPDYSHHTPSYVRRDGTPANPPSGEQDAAATQTRPIYGRYGLNTTINNDNRLSTTPLTPSSRTLPTTIRTTHFYSGKSPFSFDYSKLSTTRSPYDFSHFGRNANQAASNIDLTYVQPDIVKPKDADSSGLSSKSASTTDCLDEASDLAGSMSCHEFLSHYGFQYCQHQFMKQRCCASQQKLCPQQHS